MKTSPSSAPATPDREFYELRAYWLRPGAARALLDGFLEFALIPALNRRGISCVGVFTELQAPDGAAVWVLIPHPSMESFVRISAGLYDDPAVQNDAGEYWRTPTSANPAFERIDTWLLLAFAGMPRLELPATTPGRLPRIFELRTYPSFNEQKALKKVEMFNAGETAVMKKVGLSPVFYGQALAGRDLPHLTYMTSSPDLPTHLDRWQAFRADPDWAKLRDDPQYADTVGTITKRILEPAGYSQI